jgi:alpha,alpha-trehalose phosphorylase
VHTAALGGAWLAVVHGFCHLNLDAEGVHFTEWPVLPPHWEQVTFKFYWHGHLIKFKTDGQTITLQTNSGEVPVFYPGGDAKIQSSHPAFIPIV